ncbi:MAG: Qat anti-phage system associated protein QatB [Nostoc sp. DedSLP03]|uniref:Qat anti-phage system associated protein QatB n=1 Tax=Nostoc sp. DedSLP03 TaxID=3075400 RepID=UPI002AD556B4|nr:Qat anti-phage system associated protein QatB [Nostoc sp. DedSLP03]MDZ7970569.1 Qat anti-phage system associated protein QatB [Nostoc sp. DedSLP03]
MGTSQSHPGPGGKSSLVPPWADDQPQQPLPTPQSLRFKPFRQAFGNFVSTGNPSALKSALGHYARKSTGGRTTAARRLGNTVKAGAALYHTLTGGGSIADGDVAIDVGSLAGMPSEAAINSITQALTPSGGDSDKIRSAMNCALAEALDGVAIFDPNAITDDMIINTMIVYVSESIFLQVVQDAGQAWIKADTPSQAIAAENSLRELIKVEVDIHMAPMFSGNARSLTKSQIARIQRDVINAVWSEWEKYQ